MNKTSIEWCDYTWNPIRANMKGPRASRPHSGTFCTRISPGCTHCYASTINKRFGNGLEYTVPNLEKVEFFVDEKILKEPLRRKKPAKIFVGDMFDLFHEAIPVWMIQRVIGTAICADWHTFQFLTKRAHRMRSLIAEDHGVKAYGMPKHLWLGVSVEDQQRADERIPLLLQTPAAVRFLSVEPMLEAVTMDGKKSDGWWIPCPQCEGSCSEPAGYGGGKPCGRCFGKDGSYAGTVAGIDWLICGGESGPGARPFNLAWAESLLAQCRGTGVSFFCKQLGSNPQVHSCRNEKCTHPDCGMEDVRLKDRKGGDPTEWPPSLRVREFPAERLVA
jgi:protein gp37